MTNSKTEAKQVVKEKLIDAVEVMFNNGMIGGLNPELINGYKVIQGDNNLDSCF